MFKLKFKFWIDSSTETPCSIEFGLWKSWFSPPPSQLWDRIQCDYKMALIQKFDHRLKSTQSTMSKFFQNQRVGIYKHLPHLECQWVLNVCTLNSLINKQDITLPYSLEGRDGRFLVDKTTWVVAKWPFCILQKPVKPQSLCSLATCGVVTYRTFGLVELFAWISTVWFSPNDKTFFCRTQNFFLY